MNITLYRPVEMNIKYLVATMRIPYCFYFDCEYSTDNGKTWIDNYDGSEENTETVKSLLPCTFTKNDEFHWQIMIDIDNGKVLDWPKDLCLRTGFKICDDGEYVFTDENDKEIVNITKEYDQRYVPDFLSLEDEGYGDYIYININGDGSIDNAPLMKHLIDKYFKNMQKQIAND